MWEVYITLLVVVAVVLIQHQVQEHLLAALVVVDQVVH
jgi:hypothetical protein